MGFPKNHPPDVYLMYNPRTDQLFKPRNIKWADWTHMDPKRDMSIFMKDNEALNIPVGFPEDDEIHEPSNFFPI